LLAEIHRMVKLGLSITEDEITLDTNEVPDLENDTEDGEMEKVD